MLIRLFQVTAGATRMHSAARTEQGCHHASQPQKGRKEPNATLPRFPVLRNRPLPGRHDPEGVRSGPPKPDTTDQPGIVLKHPDKQKVTRQEYCAEVWTNSRVHEAPNRQ